jgi:hypothetical protein
MEKQSEDAQSDETVNLEELQDAQHDIYNEEAITEMAREQLMSNTMSNLVSSLYNARNF